MKVVLVRTNIPSDVRAQNSSLKVILGLKKRNIISECEAWKFSNGTTDEASANAPLPIKVFSYNENLTSEELAQYIHTVGQPDILWVDGRDYPPHLRQIMELCPESAKVIYAKNGRPWKIKNLEQYDLCLVDEEWQLQNVKKRHPTTNCFVWDKLIDHETTFRPIACEKIYDICYVAWMRESKNHELLFRAMARLQDRNLTCVCVGGDREDDGTKPDRKLYREQLERVAADLKLAVRFVGQVSQEEVNRYINQSKIGVMSSTLDTAPRALLEYMAAGAPVLLVQSEEVVGVRYVGAEAGLVRTPEEFHLGLAELLDNYQRYSPRDYFLRHFSFEQVMAKMKVILRQTGVLAEETSTA